MHSHGSDVANEALATKRVTDICFRCVNSEIYNLHRKDRRFYPCRKSSLLAPTPTTYRRLYLITYALVQAPILHLASKFLDILPYGLLGATLVVFREFTQRY